MAKTITLLQVETADILGVSLTLGEGGIVLDISYQVRSEEARVYKTSSLTVTIGYDDKRTLAQLVTASLAAINTAEGLGAA